MLRSAVREYLASEALHGLGIPTTRALCIVGSDLPVERETVETAATIIRLAPSHVRFGTFQYFAARGAPDRVRELADYVIARHFLEAGEDRRYTSFFAEVCRRTGRLMARWMAAGFAHGVMNTDNMSILGITLDYGPYGFLDGFDAGFICNHTDTGGQYAFDQQPAVGMWNCARLGEALMVLGPDPAEAEPWQEGLDSYWDAYLTEYSALMRARLGFTTRQDEDAALLSDLLRLLHADRVDYTRFFRTLGNTSDRPSTNNVTIRAMFTDAPAIEAWLDRYTARLLAEGSVDPERSERMRRTNPKYVLRNWVAQDAIDAAQGGEYGLIESLRRVLASPFDEHPAMEQFAAIPPPERRSIEVSCSS